MECTVNVNAEQLQPIEKTINQKQACAAEY